ncbi:MAG: GNAT family N-acetyltransferase, partial [Anaeroplasmataceae bacterium]|nr:GNAT family N-acetyltransferase [Anaeroplasmataceae bacterium]
MVKLYSKENFKEVLTWIEPCVSDPLFSNPNFDLEGIKEFLSKAQPKDNIFLVYTALGTGIFAFDVVEEECYIEMIFAYAREESVYEEMFDYLFKTYAGYQLDIVFNPNHPYIHNLAVHYKGEFYPVQISMQFNSTLKCEHNDHVIEYREEYFDQYRKIHSTDTYYTAEKVVKQNDFKVFLVLHQQSVVGYIDIKRVQNGNYFIYDFLVEESYRNQGYGKALLREALSQMKGSLVSLTVDIDDEIALHLYKDLGFYKIPFSE